MFKCCLHKNSIYLSGSSGDNNISVLYQYIQQEQLKETYCLNQQKVQKQPPEEFLEKVFLEISQNSQENTYVRVSEKRDKKRLWHRCFPAIRSTLIINLIHYQIGFKSQLLTQKQAPEMIYKKRCSGLQLL